MRPAVDWLWNNPQPLCQLGAACTLLDSGRATQTGMPLPQASRQRFGRGREAARLTHGIKALKQNTSVPIACTSRGVPQPPAGRVPSKEPRRPAAPAQRAVRQANGAVGGSAVCSLRQAGLACHRPTADYMGHVNAGLHALAWRRLARHRERPGRGASLREGGCLATSRRKGGAAASAGTAALNFRHVLGLHACRDDVLVGKKMSRPWARCQEHPINRPADL